MLWGRTVLLKQWSNYLTLFVLLFLAIFGTLTSPYFLDSRNLVNILLQSSINAIVAIGMTFVIITGGIDLSVGSVLALSGVIMGFMSKGGYGVFPTIIVGMGVGALFGWINGFLVDKGKIPPFIATLGTMSITRGLALILTGGLTLYGLSEGFKQLGSGYIFGFIPNPIIITFIVFFAAHFILTRTAFGLYVYAIGGNEEATRLSGIDVSKYKTYVYIISGVCAAIGGIILNARLNSAEPIAGSGYELNAIAASVIGGCTLSGGEGTVFGTIIGAIIMGMLQNILNLLNIQAYYQQLVIGLVIIGAVLMDRLRKE